MPLRMPARLGRERRRLLLWTFSRFTYLVLTCAGTTRFSTSRLWISGTSRSPSCSSMTPFMSSWVKPSATASRSAHRTRHGAIGARALGAGGRLGAWRSLGRSDTGEDPQEVHSRRDSGDPHAEEVLRLQKLVEIRSCPVQSAKCCGFDRESRAYIPPAPGPFAHRHWGGWGATSEQRGDMKSHVSSDKPSN
ncbi:hypothetical protein AOLI_G00029490 [Acnodon oligacanthus]